MNLHCTESKPGLQAFRRTVCLILISVLWLAGCGDKPEINTDGSDLGSDQTLWPAATGTSEHRDGCNVLSSEARPEGRFIIALTDSVVPFRAPVPHTSAERLVFAQLYETLVNVGCDGQIQPGLAKQWHCIEDSTVWIFKIRKDAYFWDGSPITAEDVKLAWSHNQMQPQAAGQASPWSWFDARDNSVSVLDTRRLAIQLPEPQARFPLLLSHPATAVAARRPGWTWPVGSGPCRLRASTPAPLPDIVCRPNPHNPHRPIWKELTFLIKPGLDPRDLVTSEAHLIWTRSLEAVRFFQDAPGFEPVPLPWDRLYLLICPPAQNPRGTDRWLSAAARLKIPRDITGITTRPWSEIVFPGGGPGACPQLSGPIAGHGRWVHSRTLENLHLDADGLTYNQNDPGAQELAQRLAALAGGSVRVTGLPKTTQALVLREQLPGALVVGMEQCFPSGCLQLAALLGQAAWIQKAALAPPAAEFSEDLASANALADQPSGQQSTSPATSLVQADLIRPLALTRPWLICRGQLAGLALAYDGTPLLYGLGQAQFPEVAP